jgi:hypothetical protein
MKVSTENMTAQDMFNHLFAVISGERFLSKQGLGNEIPFFICPYKPEKDLSMKMIQRQLVNRLSKVSVKVLEIDLYDLSIELLKERDIWDQIMERESSFPKDQLMELLQGVLDSAAHLIPAITKKMQVTDFHVLFITGVGEVFPYIRSHNVLNNLQAAAKERPTVMFFPGAYTHSLETGASLDLFGRLQDDKYYRAFNIFHYEP